MRRSWLMLAVVVVALAGCGGGDGGAAGGGSGSGGGSTSLDIRVGGMHGGPLDFSLSCSGATSCTDAQLDALQEVVRARGDQGRACTQIYGGPERAHVTGTLRGDRVDVVVDRTDGCGIADYDALFKALGKSAPIDA